VKSDQKKTKKELIAELDDLRRKLAVLEKEAVGPRIESVSMLTSRDKLAMFVDALPDLAFVVDGHGRILDVLCSDPDLLYAPAEHLIGLTLMEVLPDPLANRAFTAIRKTVDSGRSQQLDYQLQVPAGLHWFEGRTSLLDVPENQPAKATFIARDITERKQTELALRASQARLNTVIESLPFDFWQIGLDGRYELQNSVCRQHWGDVVGKRPEDAAPNPEVADLWRENNRRAFEGKLVTGEVKYEVDGEERHFLNILTPIKDGDSTIGIMGINIDVTDRMTLIEQMQRAQKLESIGILAGGIAHDFNNILMGITGNLSLAQADCQSAQECCRYVENAEKACRQAQHLTQQLLTFAKGGNPIRKSVNIGPFLRESVELALSGSRCTCEFDIAADLPPAYTDPGQIHQVINNLMINACQAMPGGGVIQVSSDRHRALDDDSQGLAAGRYLRIAVKDQGNGIPEEDIEKIFDPYFSTKKTGHGLGLAIAHSIVVKHNGAISIQSRAGAGTTVEVFLPSTDEQPAEEMVPGAPSTGTGRILVMDDDTTVLAVVADMLQRRGYEVTTAEDCAEAAGLLGEAKESGSPFVAMVLDLTIPGGLGGQECLKLLRRIAPGLPAIAASGYSNDPVMSNHRDYGFDDVIVKPFDSEDLARKLGSLLSAKDDRSLHPRER
jgi:PAS domain S-box-containing protein